MSDTGIASSAVKPDVTVVVITYNDAERLPDAIRSALGQTLRNLEVILVNHGSTDNTAAVADRLAANESRLTVIHLPDNEGGPGRPCNAGIDAARGRYVTILASDDLLEPDACRRMVFAADLHRADVVLGRPVRVHVHDKGRLQSWMPAVYDSPGTFQGVRENPLIIFDQISASKLYSRDFLLANQIRFPEDLIYEDQVFTNHVYLAARHIVVQSDLTYRWMVREKAERLSVTFTRGELQNLRNRIEANRRIDALYDKYAAGDLRVVKDRKFLSHDLRLYLQDLWLRSDEYQQTFVEEAGTYLETISEDVLDELPPIYRAILFLLRSRNVPLVLAAGEYLSKPSRVSVPLYRDGERVYWAQDRPSDPAAQAALDVTDLHLDRTPLPSFPLACRVASIRLEGARAKVSLEVVNPLEKIPDTEVSFGLVLRCRQQPGRAHSVPAAATRRHGYVDLEAAVDLSALPFVRARTQTWDAYVRVSSRLGDRIARVMVRPSQLPDKPVEVRPPHHYLTGGALLPYVTRKGALSFQLVNHSYWRRRAGDVVKQAADTAASIRRSVTPPIRRGRIATTHFLHSRLPIQENLVLFESFEGRQYSDGPRAIYEALHKAHPGVEAVWSYRRSARLNTFPKDVRLVLRGSAEYYRTLARARYLVDNYGLPTRFRKRDGAIYIQTWHGTPFKLMFFDSPLVRSMSEERWRHYQELVDRWDYLIATSPYFEQTFVRSANFSNELLRTGSPRNDRLVRENTTDVSMAIRQRLGLPTDRRVALYAPTYRAAAASTYSPFDMRDAARHLGDEWFFVYRQHYYRRQVRIPNDLAWFGIDMTLHPDVNDLMLASDLLISDYSSIIADYAVLGRPIILYTPDLEDYERTFGMYVDLRDVAPGPLVTDTDGLVHVLQELDDVRQAYAQRYTDFVEVFCPAEDGTASARVVKQVWG